VQVGCETRLAQPYADHRLTLPARRRPETHGRAIHL
jgi:hypothetical protein